MTLVEILVVVAIIAVLISVVAMVGVGIRDKGKIELTQQTMKTLVDAIDEYKTATKVFSGPTIDEGWPSPPNSPVIPATGDPAGRPIDRFPGPVEEQDLYLPPSELTCLFQYAGTSGARTRLLSIEGLYVYLSLVPTSKTLLDKVPGSLTTRHTDLGNIVVRPKGWPGQGVTPVAVLDAWKNPLRYRRYAYRNNGRPFLWSAGPDGKFAPNPLDLSNDPEGVGKDDLFSDQK